MKNIIKKAVSAIMIPIGALIYLIGFLIRIRIGLLLILSGIIAGTFSLAGVWISLAMTFSGTALFIFSYPISMSCGLLSAIVFEKTNFFPYYKKFEEYCKENKGGIECN